MLQEKSQPVLLLENLYGNTLYKQTPLTTTAVSNTQLHQSLEKFLIDNKT